jgi:hypothetical protein
MTSLMRQTTIKTYSTSDGETFQSKTAAVAHEINLKASGGQFADMATALGEALTGDDTRADAREQLDTLIKLSNMLDHKPRTGGRKKSDTIDGPNTAPAKGKRKAAEAATA